MNKLNRISLKINLGLVALLFVSMAGVSHAMPNCIQPPLGDIDNDGKITTADATLLQSCILQKAVPTGTDCSLAKADVNGDGKITVLDVVLINATAAGKCVKPAATATPSPTIAPQHYLYSVSATAGAIFSYLVNSRDGTLSPLASQPKINAGFLVSAIVADGTHRFVYSLSNTSIQTFLINQTNGSLTAGPVVRVATGSQLVALTIDPKNRFLYAADPSTIYAYSINSTTGTLTLVGSGLTINTGGTMNPSVASMTIDPTGRFLYAADEGISSISTYSINTDGSLTMIALPVPLRTAPNYFVTGPAWLSTDPAGKFVYCVNNLNNTFSVLSIGTNGSLTPLNNFTVGFGNGITVGFIVAPNGKFAYLVQSTSVTIFKINSDGSLASTSTTSIPAGITGAYAIDYTGKYLYFANNSNSNNTFSAFSIDQNAGTLTPIGTNPVTGGNMRSATITH